MAERLRLRGDRSGCQLYVYHAYDWHHAGSEPGPVAPITEIRRTIEFTIAQVPSRKIIIGVPLYGYDWIIPYQPGTVASAISNQNAIERAMRYQPRYNIQPNINHRFSGTVISRGGRMRYGLRMSGA